MIDPQDLLAALLLGVVGSTHCIGMCGGISAALSFALGPRKSALQRHALLVLMGLGRVCSYAAAGAVAGALLPSGPAGPLPALRIAAGLLLVLMGVAIAGWPTVIGVLERSGARAWQRVTGGWLRVERIATPSGALIAGLAWGWLPCGLVYSSLAWAASKGEATPAALLMAAFGLGTLPAVVVSGALASRLRSVLQERGWRLLAALLVIGFGVWTLAAAPGDGHVQHSHHGHGMPQNL